ncbi:NUDIX hydrolase [Kordiimonas laminariae]|uniref:NUDIX hydrolase n=1 Tax=Kordiimonas laminariae TaxID=2917717 RepID=UPI001FF63AD3|nr:NUDIX hydrolase [Kordiimonas laminariae]MCK0071010.1 NUDIX hydrolase [Kordiimonas laminariae]
MANGQKIVTPLPAASVLLVRDGEAGLEVLMTERAKTMKFAPGAFVFPGGKVDVADSEPEFVERYTDSETSEQDVAFKVAVLRELYEEAGIYYSVAERDTQPSGRKLVELLSENGDQLATSKLVHFAHWVTPEPIPRRFDTHFYIVPHNGQTAKHDGNEAISLRWVSPRAILDEWDHDKVPLMFPTRLNLMKLARANSVYEALKQAKDAEVVRTLPVIGMDENGMKLTISEECGYGVTQATMKEMAVEAVK